MEITQDMRDALDDARAAQMAYWMALGQLEALLEVDVDGEQDLNDTTVELLLGQ